MAAYCEHDNEPTGLIKDGEFLHQLNDYQLLKKDCAPWNYEGNLKSTWTGGSAPLLCRERR
jgi:hypothetical protein